MALPIPTTEKRVYTRDDLRALYELPENKDKLFELINGVINEVPTGTLFHSWIRAIIFGFLYRFVTENHLGMVFGDSTGYDMPNGDTVIPDVSFISNDRLPDPEEELTIAPDLAVEVASLFNSPRNMLEKVESYLESGTRRVWVVYPDERVVNVFKAQSDGSVAYTTHRVGDALSGEDVLPGLTLAVAEIFPASKPVVSPEPTDAE